MVSFNGDSEDYNKIEKYHQTMSKIDETKLLVHELYFLHYALFATAAL